MIFIREQSQSRTRSHHGALLAPSQPVKLATLLVLQAHALCQMMDGTLVPPPHGTQAELSQIHSEKVMMALTDQAPSCRRHHPACRTSLPTEESEQLPISLVYPTRPKVPCFTSLASSFLSAGLSPHHPPQHGWGLAATTRKL